MSDRGFMLIGLLANSALYLAGVFIAGLATHNGVAWKLALASTGLAYLGYVLQLDGWPKALCGTTVAASIVAGAVAGLALLVLPVR